MKFCYISPSGSVYAVTRFRKADADDVMRRIIPASAYLGPCHPRLLGAILAAQPETPAAFRAIRDAAAPTLSLAGWPPAPPASILSAAPPVDRFASRRARKVKA